MNACEGSLAEGEECSGSPVMYSGSSSRTNHASANGSIITMTLKNNHLIVETEERNVGEIYYLSFSVFLSLFSDI